MLSALDNTQLANLMLKSKADVFRFFYTRGWVTLCVDATSLGVDVPSHLKGDTNLRVRVGANLPLPTSNVRVGSTTIKATLFFDGRPYPCAFTWKSIMAVIGQEEVGLVWSDTKVFLVRKKSRAPSLTVLRGGLDKYGCDEDAEIASQERRSAFAVIKDDKWTNN